MDSREELLRRQALAGPSDVVQGMFFGAVAGLVEREAGAERAAALRTSRRFPKRPVPFMRYPAADFLAVVDEAIGELTARKLPYPEALHAVGMGIVETFMEGPVGKLMVSMLGGDPNRMLGGGPSAYAATFSFGKREYVRRSESEGAFRFSRELLGPEISRGILKQGIELSCPVTVTTRIEEAKDTTEFAVQVTWVKRASATPAPG